MPSYQYQVAHSDGRVEALWIEGDDPEDALTRIRARQLVPIRRIDDDAAPSARWLDRLIPGRGIDLDGLTERLLLLLDADIQVEPALAILEETTTSESERALVDDLRRGLHEGRPLSRLAADRPHIFPPLYSRLLAVGEQSGTLVRVLGELQRHLQFIRRTRSFLVSSSIYPAVVLLTCVGVLGVLFGVVIPRFSRILLSSGKTPSWSTRFVLGCSLAIREWWWLVLLCAGVIGVAVIFAYRLPAVRRLSDRVVLRLPVFGYLARLINLSLFMRTLAVMIDSGVQLLDAVSSAIHVIGNCAIRDSLQHVCQDLRKGDKLSLALEKSPYVPSMVTKMLAVGEESGSHAEILKRLAERSDTEFQQTVKRLLALFEPLVIVVLGLIVGGLVFSLFYAILEIQKAV